MRPRIGLLALLAGVTFLSCGGGGNTAGSNPSAVNPPSSLVYPQVTIVAVVGQTIAADTPTITGTVASYSISPALPAGLSLNSSTGMLSGTPTAVTARASYIVTASNPAGSTTATLQIAVNPVPPSNLVYPQGTLTAEVGREIPANIPSVTGGVASYTVSPTLPAGLNLNSATGTISGVPTAASAAGDYVVTASNAGGGTTATLRITVTRPSTVLLELGHSGYLKTLRLNDSRLLSQDYDGYWALWNLDSSALIRSGSQSVRLSYDTPDLYADMAGQTVVVPVPNGLEVRASSDGHVLSTIVLPGVASSSPPWWRLASDGGYICAGSKIGLSIWSPTGQVLVSRTGDYSNAKAFAAAGEVRVASGPAGQNVIETISTTSGASSTSTAFSGQFHSWFLDGERFFTNESNTVWVYSKTGAQQSIIALPVITGLTGQGNRLSICSSSSLQIYDVGSSSPTFTYGDHCSVENLVHSSNTISVFDSGLPTIAVIDLSGSSPTAQSYHLPIARLSNFAASSSSRWIVSNAHGAILDGASLLTAPRYYGLGKVWSMAGSTRRVVISTAVGKIFSFDPAATTPEVTLDFPSSKVALSSDGTILACLAETNDDQFETDRTLKVFSLPGGTARKAFPYTYQQNQWAEDFTLAGSGATLGIVLKDNASGLYTRKVLTGDGWPTIWSDVLSWGTQTTPEIQLSPDGTLIAVSNNGPYVGSSTNIYKNGVLVTAVPGYAAGWIDDSRILANHYVWHGTAYMYSDAAIYDSAGAVVATPKIPDLRNIQPVGADSVYDAHLNAIYSVTAGQVLWRGPNGKNAAVSGPYVVYVSGSRVLAETY